jgi:hypothetical protein
VPHRFVLATSWAQSLGDLADELEAGNFLADKKHRFGSFLVKKRRTAPLYTQWWEAEILIEGIPRGEHLVHGPRLSACSVAAPQGSPGGRLPPHSL